MSELDARTIMTETADAKGATPTTGTGTNTQRGVRGRYAKFNGGMDVLLLEALREHNPFTAKHGTRLQMWQSIAEIVGAELFKNPDAYSWHTCRDRVTALMKMYTDGKHDKLFKHGTVEENARKEAILRELNLSIARKNKVTVRPAASLLETSVAAAATAGATSTPSSVLASSASATAAALVTRARMAPAALGSTVAESPGAASAGGAAPFPKRRRLEGTGGAAAAASGLLDDASAHAALASGSHSGSNGSSASDAGAHVDSDAFRARVLSLIEAKVQFDMEQRVKESALREQEIELQKRFLDYLQSK